MKNARAESAVRQGAALGDEMTQVATMMMDRVVQNLPNLAGALLLLLAGWVLAKFLRALTGRMLALLEIVFARLLGVHLAERVRLARSANVLGALVFWAVLLFFVTAATNVLGLDTFTLWLGRLLDYLPTLIVGLLIVVAGYILSRVAADLILGATGQLAPAQRQVVARAAQATILVAAILVGADQIGIRVTFLAIIVGIAAGAVAGGVVVAVSLGARTHVANLIGAHQLRLNYELGQRIRVAGFEGRILQLTPQAVVLETDDGRVSVPGRLFSEQPVALIAQDR
jgi:Conserved TM helix/Mechanosensitive ion channel